MKKLFYSASALVLGAQANITNAGLQITGRGEEELAGATDLAGDSIPRYINLLTSFLTLIAVIYAIWGWFLILTAAGDEDKVKKWRTVILNAALGLVVIWLAYSIVRWISGLLIWDVG